MAETNRMILIKLDLDLEPDQDLDKVEPAELGEALGSEFRRFGQWFEKQGNVPLVMAETAIIKTFLGWKIKFDGKS